MNISFEKFIAAIKLTDLVPKIYRFHKINGLNFEKNHRYDKINGLSLEKFITTIK
jgi:hypothetical protein